MKSINRHLKHQQKKKKKLTALNLTLKSATLANISGSDLSSVYFKSSLNKSGYLQIR